MVIRAARRSSHLQGQGTHLISQLFQDPDYWSCPGNRTRDLPLFSFKSTLMTKQVVPSVFSWNKTEVYDS